MRIGRVEISPGFLFLGAWLNYADHQGIFWSTMFSCAVHEVCHLCMLHLLHIPVRRVCITAVGAEICVDSGMSYRGEMAAALAGPLGNFLLAWTASRFPGGELLAGVNLALGMFNLIPVGRLDGGRFLHCGLSVLMGPERGEWVSRQLSCLCLLGLCLTGIRSFCRFGNLTMPLIVLWMLYSFQNIGENRKKRTK